MPAAIPFTGARTDTCRSRLRAPASLRLSGGLPPTRRGSLRRVHPRGSPPPNGGGLVQKHPRFLVPGGEILSSPEGPQWRRGRVTPPRWLFLPLPLTCEPGVSIQIQIQSPLSQAVLPEGSKVRVPRPLPSRLVQSLQVVWASERKLSQQDGTVPRADQL